MFVCYKRFMENLNLNKHKSLNGLRYHLPNTYNAESSLNLRQFHSHSHLASCDRNTPFQAGGQFRGDKDCNDMRIGRGFSDTRDCNDPLWL